VQRRLQIERKTQVGLGVGQAEVVPHVGVAGLFDADGLESEPSKTVKVATKKE